MDVLEYLKNNVYPKYWQTEIAANSSQKYEIGVELPVYIHTIIGIVSPADGLNTQNTALATHTNMLSLYLNLVKGGSFIFENIRFDTIHEDNVGSTRPGERFFSVNIQHNDIDLQRCYILNPSGLSVAITIGFLYL